MSTTLKKLLGSLELEVMRFMWRTEEATVQEVTDAISRKRRVAYTTIMTVLVHLVGKGLLTRLKEGKKYRYTVVFAREEFLRESARRRFRDLIFDFGETTVASFLEEKQLVPPDKLERLKKAAGGDFEV